MEERNVVFVPFVCQGVLSRIKRTEKKRVCQLLFLIKVSEMTNDVTQASSVYAFKNGFCLIIKQFQIPANIEGKPRELFDLPSTPVHGTFSIQTTPNGNSRRGI